MNSNELNNSTDTCQISGLSLISRPEWIYDADDGHYSAQLQLLGKDILIWRGIGYSEGEDIDYYLTVINSAIREFFGQEDFFYLLMDYSELSSASLGSRRVFSKWALTIVDRIPIAVFYGMNRTMRIAVTIGKSLSSTFSNVRTAVDYEAAVQLVLKHKAGNIIPETATAELKEVISDADIPATRPDEFHTRIKEITGLMGNMTWLGQLDQEIPELPSDNPFSDLYQALANIQQDMRILERERRSEYDHAHQEIDRRKQKEIELQKLSQAVEQSPVSVVITDPKGNIEYVNPKSLEVTGYSFAEIKGQNPRIFKSGEQTKAFYKDLWDTIKAGKEWRGEFHNRKKDGELFWESAVISPIINEMGEVTHFLAVKEDITLKRQLDEELTASHFLNQTLLNTIPFGMEIVDEYNNILFLNDKMKAVLGEDALNQKCFTQLKDSKTQCANCPVKKGITIGKTDSLEVGGVLGGRTFLINHTGMKYQGKKAILEIFQDITDRKQVEKELLDQKQRELTANALYLAQQSQLVHSVQTELRNALIAASPETKVLIRKTVSQLNETLQSEKQWQDFEIHFKDVHPEFYEILDDLYPQLTGTERRICAFLKMNLNTKEIASLLNVTVRAVEQHRYRIRKKLEISSGVSLSAHLISMA